jgi:hypothetical protein
MDRVKLSDLIAKAEEKKAHRKERKDIYVKSLGGLITIEKPDRALCLDVLDMGKDGDSYLVYECVVDPNLKDPALIQAYGCVQPIEVVEKIFEPGEIAQIAKIAVELAGYGDSVKLVDDLKN